LSSALLTVAVGTGYFLVWTLLGAAVYPATSAIEALTTRYPPIAASVPVAIGLVVLAAGVLQFTRWKARVLARCRAVCCPESHGAAGKSFANISGAWHHGLRLGLQCAQCCAGVTAALLVTGMMDLPLMLAATGAITLERLAPAGERVARVVGLMMMGGGGFLILRAGGLG
jgi:predicted metal-binding membrane protein